MSKITLLSTKDLEGNKKLDIFKKIGIRAQPTDAAIIAGSEGEAYYTNDFPRDNSWGTVYGVIGEKIHYNLIIRKCSIGHRYKKKYYSEIPSNSGEIKYINGIPITEYGYNSGKKVPEELQNDLEKAYEKGEIDICRGLYKG